jgi:hypothetical protein
MRRRDDGTAGGQAGQGLDPQHTNRFFVSLFRLRALQSLIHPPIQWTCKQPPPQPFSSVASCLPLVSPARHWNCFFGVVVWRVPKCNTGNRARLFPHARRHTFRSPEDNLVITVAIKYVSTRLVRR